MKRRSLAVLISVIILLMLLPGAAAADSFDCEEEIMDILEYDLSVSGDASFQEWLDTDLADGAGVSSEWTVFALSQYKGGFDFSAYCESLDEYLSGSASPNPTAYLRCAMMFQACEGSSDCAHEIIDENIGKLGIMSWVYGLHLLNNGAISELYTASDVVEQILSMQLEGGGWCIYGENADVDVTAMTIQAIGVYYGIDDDVTEAVDRGIAILSERQNENGGYTVYGSENPESTSMVIVALTGVGIDCLSDERFIKNGNTLFDGLRIFKNEDGSYSHGGDGTYNGLATAEALTAYVSYWRYVNHTGTMYIFNQSGTRGDSLQPRNGDGQENGGESGSLRHWKLYAYIIIAAASVAVIVLFIIKKKKNYKSYIFILAVAAVLCAAVSFIDIESTEDYYNPSDNEGVETISTVIEIRCDTVRGEEDYIPEDGIILARTEIMMPVGSTAFEQLVEACKTYKIHLESDSSKSGYSGGAYIKGINYIYEYQFGELSGWMFSVNDSFSSVGAGEYALSEGDYILWQYTKEIGNDIGNIYMPEE